MLVTGSIEDGLIEQNDRASVCKTGSKGLGIGGPWQLSLFSGNHKDSSSMDQRAIGEESF